MRGTQCLFFPCTSKSDQVCDRQKSSFYPFGVYFQTVADCAVFPSLYEPFGIIALESFASRVPVVVSDTGELPEVVFRLLLSS
jgi:hypothetical protein